MTRTEERADTDLVQENKQLRRALETLLDELEEDGPVDTSRVREKMPANDRDRIQPPWEREGYDSKQAWLNDRRESNGDHGQDQGPNED